ncbi:MAG: phosphopantetheine-binding protein, partial [Ardenticatenaceae bacterium]
MEELSARKTLEALIGYLEAAISENGKAKGESGALSDEVQSPKSVGEGAAALNAEQISSLLLRLVSDKTGYPVEMLNPALDLEADLGIDSIKRVEILGAFQQEAGVNLSQQMEELSARKTLQEMVSYLSGADALHSKDTPPDFPLAPPVDNPGTAQTAMEQPNFPFVEEVVAFTPGESLVARCTLDPIRFPFLRDHTLGRSVSVTDRTLTGLPVMPLTMSMELMAEAAATLMPGLHLVGMHEVRTYRWIPIEEEGYRVQVTAQRQGTGDAVHVQVRDVMSAARTANEQTLPILEGTM